jgi:hypothetical protein
VDIKRTAEQIREKLQWRKGDPLLLGALADMAEEEGDTRRAPVFRESAVIGKEVNDLLRLKQEEENRHKKEMKRIAVELEKVRLQCLHSVTEWYPDASGNNDDTTECLVCGKELDYGEGYDG